MIETKMLPTAPWKGLYLDGVTVPGGMSKADNVYILPDGSAERRLFQRTLLDSETCLASRGVKAVYELRKSDGKRYLFADIDTSSTAVISYGAEQVTHFTTPWTAAAGWTWGTNKQTHSTGTTSIVATGEPAIVAGTKYRVVVGVTQTPPSGSGGGWAFTATDSGAVWTGTGGDTHPIWNLKWTHTTGTTPLTAIRDFTILDGESYRVYINVTHTSGGALSIYMGQTLVGAVTVTGQYEFIATFVDFYTANADLYKNAMRFVPANDFVGSVNVDWFPSVSPNNATISVKKMIDPAGANIPSNYEIYDWELGLVNVGWPMNQWYAEETAQVSQSLVVYIGGTLGGVIQASGTHTFDVVASTTAALTFTPTTAWPGSINSVSVKIATIDSGTNTKMKIIGGLVTGTTTYDATWGDIKLDLNSGAAVLPMWATMMDRAFHVDGTNINYYFKDTTAAHTLGVPPPVDAPVCASATGGELTADTYSIWYTYVKKDGDDVVEGNPSPVTTLTIAGNAITVALISNPDKDITHIRIYRTLYNELGSDAYRAMEVLNSTQTITLIASDDVIGDGEVLVYNHNMPKRAMFVLTGGSRLWMLRFPSEVGGDSMMMWSEVGNPEYMPALNYQTFDPDDGDKVMGAAMMQNNLMVFKRHRTWICDVYSMQTIDGVSSIAKHVLSPTIGCIASGSIQSVDTESCIWLSSEGVMLYAGGEIKNISKDRINSVINFFMNHGAEYNIDSIYHSTKRQYHINFLYRNDAGTEIVAQRHFVYSLDADAWTEYIYTSASGTRYYELNFCLASDSNMNEIILIPHLVTSTHTISYIYQTDYEIGGTAFTNPLLLIDHGGDGATDMNGPWFSIVDSDNNVYVVTSGVGPTATDGINVFKVTSNRVKALLVTNDDIVTATGLTDDTPSEWSLATYPPAVDLTNDCFYIKGRGKNTGGSTGDYYRLFILRITFGGACTLIALTDDVGYAKQTINSGGILKLNSDGTKLYYDTNYDQTEDVAPIDWVSSELHEVTAIGEGGQTDTVIQDTITHDYTDPTSEYRRYSSYDTSGDYLFITVMEVIDPIVDMLPYCHLVDITRKRWWLYRVSMTDGTQDIFNLPEINVLTLGPIVTLSGLMAASDTKLYTLVSYGSTSINYGIEYNGLDWVCTPTALSGVSLYKKKTNGDFIVLNGYDIETYDSNLALKDTQTLATGGMGYTATTISYLVGSEYMELILVIPVWGSDDVFMLWPDGYWQIVDETINDGGIAPTMAGVIVNIVSNYEDLGLPNYKRIKRLYLPVSSQWATCGAVTIEPDAQVNMATHVDGETTEPANATSLRPFAHPGSQSWKYTNDQFDSAVEDWKSIRIDVGTQGTAVRYSIQVGDVPLANSGLLRIRPPRVMAQIKNVY